LDRSSVEPVIVTPPEGRYIGHAKHRRPDPDPEFMRVGPGTPCGE